MVHTYRQQAEINRDHLRAGAARIYHEERGMNIAAVCILLVMPLTFAVPYVREFYPWEWTSLVDLKWDFRYSVRGMFNLMEDGIGTALLVLSAALFIFSALIASIPLIKKAPFRRGYLIPAKIFAILSLAFTLFFVAVILFAAAAEWPFAGCVPTIAGIYAIHLHIGLLVLLFLLSSRIRRREKSHRQGAAAHE